MFEITIKGETLLDLSRSLFDMAQQFGTTIPQTEPAPKPTTRKAKAAEPKTIEPAPEDIFVPDPADDPTPEPMPAGAAVVVDAGTGRPVEQALNTPVEEPVKQMTFDDVKAAAAKLAAKDTPALAAILKKYNAAKLSEVSKDQLGDFAGDVVEALG